jgi:hypothetical protein
LELGLRALPDGFSELVSLVVKNWTLDNLPENDSDIWEAIIYPIFLGPTVRSAQANYAKQVLWGFIEFDAAHTVPNDPIWSRRVLAAINNELQSVAGTPGEGLKRAILQTTSREVESLNLSRTIGTALDFFNIAHLNVQVIINLQNDYPNTLELVDLAARLIYNVRYVKAVLWLYSCGIAEDLAPPNNHTTKFLDECGYPGFGWSRDPIEDSQIFTPACRYMKEVARQVETELNQRITPKQAQSAVWYLQTCRGLINVAHKRRLTPAQLIDFLDTQGLTIDQLGGDLDDVERIGGLSSDLTSFYRTLR